MPRLVFIAQHECDYREMSHVISVDALCSVMLHFIKWSIFWEQQRHSCIQTRANWGRTKILERDRFASVSQSSCVFAWIQFKPIFWHFLFVAERLVHLSTHHHNTRTRGSPELRWRHVGEEPGTQTPLISHLNDSYETNYAQHSKE